MIDKLLEMEIIRNSVPAAIGTTVFHTDQDVAAAASGLRPSHNNDPYCPRDRERERCRGRDLERDKD